MNGFDGLDVLFVVWAFFFQVVLVIHFAVRKRFFETYTERFGWVVYALSIPAAAISVVLLLGGKTFDALQAELVTKANEAMREPLLKR